MPTEHNSEVMRELLTSCALELFADYGVVLEPAKAPVSPSEMVAVVGFTSDEMRGTLAISAQLDFFSRTNVISSEPTEEQIRDWAGELGNQLMGRVKNRLLAYNLVLAMGTPMVIIGMSMHLGQRRTGIVNRLAWTSSQGDIEAWLEASHEAGLWLERSAAAEDAIQAEGDLLFF
ncbi:MAG: chemotaxis protein CheX [Deltaproteobacteria bacterium]|nr:chemotaxis protein CheX [Deltaproteobacteria bacterium]